MYYILFHFFSKCLNQFANCTFSSLVVSEVAPRSLSLGMEFPERSKRPAIICDFFAKGWCIRGSSCRFLHVKDDPDTSSKQHVEEKSDERDKGA